MNDQHDVVALEYDQLEEVARSIGTGEQEPWWILVEFDPGDRVLRGMEDVVISDAVPSRGAVHFHTEIA